MKKIILSTERCKACEYCIHFCPKNAIELTSNFNNKGYKTIAIDEAKCVGCGICYSICPDSVIEIFNDAKEGVAGQ